MDVKIHPLPNPYQTPADVLTAKPERIEPTGLIALLAGIGVIAICTLVLGYLMLAEVPCLRKDCSQRNVDVPELVTMGENVVIFICENSFILLPGALVALILLETSTSGCTKRRIRRTLGIVVGTAVVIFTVLVAWAVLSAMNWKLLSLS